MLADATCERCCVFSASKFSPALHRSADILFFILPRLARETLNKSTIYDEPARLCNAGPGKFKGSSQSIALQKFPFLFKRCLPSVAQHLYIVGRNFAWFLLALDLMIMKVRVVIPVLFYFEI